MMNLPLEGIKVVDTTGFAMGPYASSCLADMGARVIKIEDPIGGDRGRGIKSVKHVAMGSHNWLHEAVNRGKQSFAVNWKTEDGKKVLCKLIETADVFMTNMKPKTLKKTGLDYPMLSGINSRLIYAHCTGWGSKGPYSNVDAFDLIAFAKAGLMTVMGEPDSPPTKLIPGMGDITAGMVLAYGIVMALFHRERTGEGQIVETSLLNSQITMFALGALQPYLSNRKGHVYDSRKEPANALTNTYRTKDGRWLMLSMMTADASWPEFCEVVGAKELTQDLRFISHETRCHNATALRKILDGLFASRALSEWKDLFKEHEFAWSPCQTMEEVASDPQVIENESIITYEHPELGPLRILGFPVKFSRTSAQIRSPAPELGQHTEEILQELSYDWEEITRLKENRTII